METFLILKMMRKEPLYTQSLSCYDVSDEDL